MPTYLLYLLTQFIKEKMVPIKARNYFSTTFPLSKKYTVY